jgi:hypothetical protein
MPAAVQHRLTTPSPEELVSGVQVSATGASAALPAPTAKTSSFVTYSGRRIGL